MSKDLVKMNGANHPKLPEGQLVLVPPGYLLSTETPEPPQQASLFDIIRLIWRKRWLISLVLLLCIGAALVFLHEATPVYQSTAKMRIEPEESKIVSFHGQDVTVNSSGKTFNEFLNTQLQIIQGRQLAIKVMERLNLTEARPVPPPPGRWGIADKAHEAMGFARAWIGEMIQPPRPVTLADSKQAGAKKEELEKQRRIEAFVGQLSIRPLRETELIEISFASPDPSLSAEVVNTLCDEYIKWTYESKDESYKYAREWLKQKLDEVKNRLEQTENELLELPGSANFVASADNKLPEQLESLRQKMAEAERTLFEKQFNYQRYASEKNFTALNSISDSRVSRMMETLATRKVEYDRMSVPMGPNSQEVRALKAEIDGLQRQIREEFVAAKQKAQIELDQAQAGYDFLKKMFEAEKGRISGIQKDMIQYNILNREVSVNRELYNNLLQRWKEIGVAAGAKVGYASVIDPAVVPLLPRFPGKLRTVVLAVLFGLGLGVGLVLLLDTMDSSIKDPIELERLTRLPIIGYIPRCERSERRARVEFMICERPHSEFAEAVRAIRTAIQYAQSDGAPQAIMVTSCLPGEGKTTVATNLALALAGLNKRVLLVDADLKKSMLSRLFRVFSSKGLAEILTGQAGEETIAETSVENLHILAGGSRLANPVELLDSDAMRQFLRQVAVQYDHVIIDTPPAFAMADASVLAPYVDGVLLVVRPGATPREAVRRVKDRLVDVQGNMLGIVANNPTWNAEQRFAQRLGFGNGYDYGKHYGHLRDRDWNHSRAKAMVNVHVIEKQLAPPVH